MNYLIQKLYLKDSNECLNLLENEPNLNKFKRMNGWGLNSIKETINYNQSKSYGCYVNKKLIGFIFSRYYLNDLEILIIFIKKGFRKNGLGRSLITYLIQQLSDIKCLNIHIEVSENNYEANLFYKKCGFKIVSTRKNYYILKNGNKENAKIYSLTINTVK